jgi:hypothetical protein
MDDPELKAMGAIASALDGLEDNVKDRVLRWARDRYGVSLKAQSPAPTPASVSYNTTSASSRETFNSVASLVDAANPAADSDKLLVVAYWFQVIRGESELDSQSLNSELKNLGYPIGNITRAVSNLASTTPRLVMQIKKSGTTRQARKKFRLTVEGIRRVETMTGGPVGLIGAHEQEA